MLQRALATPLALRTIGFGSDPTPYVWDGKHTFRVATPEEVRAMKEWETRDYREDVTALNLARNDDLIGARPNWNRSLAAALVTTPPPNTLGTFASGWESMRKHLRSLPPS